MSNKTNSAFRVHVHSGQVWIATPDQMPVPAAKSVIDFVGDLPVTKSETVQVIASPDNVSLILHLYQSKLAGRISSLQICSPALCSQGEAATQPEIAMMNMSQWQGWPASLGGWHEFDEDDYSSYVLLSNFNDGVAYEVVAPIFELHPAYKALSFIHHLNKEYVARLISLILDPRWYVDPEEPEKNSRLEGFLGLDPKTVAATTSSANSDKAKQSRCNLVLRSWRNARPVSKEEYECPHNFLWRAHAMEGADYKADLRVSQIFIAFLKNVWLAALYKKRNTAGSDGLFVPDYFFKHKDEVVAFKKHMAS